MRASGTEDSPMRASGSAAALRAMGEQIDDAVELDEMERLTRALDPPRTPEQPRHEREGRVPLPALEVLEHLEDGAHVALDLGVCATAEKCVAGS